MDRMLILEMAFALVAESPDWERMTTDARIEEVSRAFEKMLALAGFGEVIPKVYS
jgi:hypothetical protein